MPELITTRSVTRGIVEAEEIELCKTARTRVVFRGGIHEGGVRGFIIRQKIGADGTWKDTNEVNFTHVPADCGVIIELSTEATGNLYARLSQLKEVLRQRGIEHGEQTYIVGTPDETIVVNDQNKAAAIRELLDHGYSEDFWQELAKSNPDLATRLAAARMQYERRQAIAEFEASLTANADSETYWQDFFENRPWILQSAFAAPVVMLNGETYLGGKGPVGRQGKGGVVTDFLFADDSTKSFAVVEIKTPHAKLVGGQYRGERGTGLDNVVFSMDQELSGGVVQVRNQITVAVEDFQSVLKRGFSDAINRIHPKGVLVIGTTTSLSQRQKDSFNQFRHGFHDLTIITFDELLTMLKLLYVDDRTTADSDRWADEPVDAFDPTGRYSEEPSW
jgi:hypothetical protein